MKRFFYVQAPGAAVVHIQYGRSHSEGPVKCGIQSHKGWAWMTPRTLPICKRCAA